MGSEHLCARMCFEIRDLDAQLERGKWYNNPVFEPFDRTNYYKQPLPDTIHNNNNNNNYKQLQVRTKHNYAPNSQNTN